MTLSPRTPRAMTALEILRETARILRAGPSPFLLSLALLISPVSAALLSGLLSPPSAAAVLSSLLLPLPLPRRLSSSLLSAAASLPLLLPARAAAALAVASSYAARPFAPLSPLRRSYRRVLLTHACFLLASLALLLLSLALLLLLSLSLSALGYPPEIVAYPALLPVLAFAVSYAHATVVGNLALVISVLEDASGPHALLRSARLMRGQTRAGLIMFLGSALGMGFVEGLFDHRVKTLSYGDGSSRLWEGPLLVVMYSFVVLIDSMMSAVFYFSCRSSSMEAMGEEITPSWLEEDEKGSVLTDIEQQEKETLLEE